MTRRPYFNVLHDCEFRVRITYDCITLWQQEVLLLYRVFLSPANIPSINEKEKCAVRPYFKRK